MSDALDLDQMESDWEYEGPERAYSRAAFPILVAEVRRLRAENAELRQWCEALTKATEGLPLPSEQMRAAERSDTDE